MLNPRLARDPRLIPVPTAKPQSSFSFGTENDALKEQVPNSQSPNPQSPILWGATAAAAALGVYNAKAQERRKKRKEAESASRTAAQKKADRLNEAERQRKIRNYLQGQAILKAQEEAAKEARKQALRERALKFKEKLLELSVLPKKTGQTFIPSSWKEADIGTAGAMVVAQNIPTNFNPLYLTSTPTMNPTLSSLLTATPTGTLPAAFIMVANTPMPTGTPYPTPTPFLYEYLNIDTVIESVKSMSKGVYDICSPSLSGVGCGDLVGPVSILIPALAEPGPFVEFGFVSIYVGNEIYQALPEPQPMPIYPTPTPSATSTPSPTSTPTPSPTLFFTTPTIIGPTTTQTPYFIKP